MFVTSAVGILLAAATAVFTQYQIESWTTDNGLPQNTVHSIVQTPNGYLWLATLDGLVRFDGVRFTVFNKQNTKSINSNRFSQLVVDVRGDLWIRTEDNRVARYSDGKFHTFPLDAAAYSFGKLGLTKEREPFVIVDKKVFNWDGEGFKFYTNIAGNDRESTVLLGKNGSLWVANGRILSRRQGDNVSEYILPAVGKDWIIVGLFEDSRGRLWIGTNNTGLFVFENEKFTAYTVKDGLPTNNIAPFIEDRNGSLWAATSNGAVVITDGRIERITTEQGLSDNILTSIYEDREGSIWIGALFRGLNRLRPQSVTFYSKKDGLTANVIRPIYQDRDGTIWIGGENLTRYRDGRFSGVPGRESQLQPTEVTAIEQDRSGRLWFGHWAGVYYFENGKFTDFTDTLDLRANIMDIHEDRAGTLWFASNRGLFRYQNGAMTRFTTADGLPSDDVKIIHESTDGTLWIGTYGGLVRLEREMGRKGDGEKGGEGEKENLDETGSVSSSPLLPISPSPHLPVSPSPCLPISLPRLSNSTHSN
ncbi:MAG: ligand-binding sensor domain-containing protein [Pyrinomonadaceae bacterium]